VGSWDTHDGGYDIENFYTRASDKHGHGSQFRVRLPTDVAGMVARIIADPTLPQFRTAADFLRDAAFHRLQYLNRKVSEGAYSEDLTLAIVRHNATKRKQDYEAAQEHVQDIEDMLSKYRLTGQWGEMHDLIEEQIEAVHLLPPDAKKRMTELLERHGFMGGQNDGELGD